jgi:hypothetical protein
MMSELIVYQSAELTERIEVKIEAETVWLSLNQISQLFGRDKSVISRHLSNIFKEGELIKEATVAKFATVQIEAGRSITRDAYIFVADLIRKARKSLILIDNYLDDSVLTLLNKRKKGVDCICYTKTITKNLKLDLEKHNSQYPPIEVREFDAAHDRFLIIDRKELYHIGASLKDLGKKWFGFSRMDVEVLSILKLLKVEGNG